MAKDTTEILDEVEEIEPLQYEAEKPLILRQEAFLIELGYQFKLNTVRDAFEYKYKDQPWLDLKERVYKTIRREFKLSNSFRGKGEVPTIKGLEEMVDIDSISPKYNPFKDFFNNTKWDGKDRLTDLINTVTTANRQVGAYHLQDLWRLLFTRWMIACAACSSSEDGTPIPNHVMLLLMSEQHGTFKTSWLNNLCPPALKNYATCGNIVPTLTDGNTCNLVAEKFIVNIDDQLDTIMYKDFGAIKSLITVPFVTNRKVFRRDDNTRNRRANFCGSVNNKNIFTDSENRRYLTFEISKIDFFSAQKIDINQVWAQVYSMYKTPGQDYHFGKDYEALINDINDLYRQTSAEFDYFTKMFTYTPTKTLTAKFYTPSEIESALKKASGINIYSKNLAVVYRRLKMETKARSKSNNIKPGQSREGFWLEENFKREGDRIIIHEDPEFENLTTEEENKF